MQTVYAVCKAVELTDESDKPANVQPQSRSERNHTFRLKEFKVKLK
ncbi:hypothetical protein PO124_26410 [Bacillus licheniformis]|nr:hypothetical protein [Bacillus licheniformis]